MYLRPVASGRGNTVNVLNILRWYALCDNICGFYLCYRSVGVKLSGDGAALCFGPMRVSVVVVLSCVMSTVALCCSYHVLLAVCGPGSCIIGLIHFLARWHENA